MAARSTTSARSASSSIGSSRSAASISTSSSIPASTAAYGSVEYLTHQQWYAGGVMRSLHRYASDAMVVVMVLHLLREFSLDRYRGPRWFTWVTGVPILLLVVASGITGYWLVWDKLAQYVAIVTTEWLDQLPIFGQSIARNFLSPDSLDDRFFTLLVFMHIVLPLLLLLVLWIHLQRVSRPQINPARGLADRDVPDHARAVGRQAGAEPGAGRPRHRAGAGRPRLVLPRLLPAARQLAGRGDLGPRRRAAPDARCAALAAAASARAGGGGRPRQLQRLHPLRRRLPVQRDHHDAAHRRPRVRARSRWSTPGLCVSCGICAGACPTSMPFRRASELVPGIDLPSLSMATLRDRVNDAAASLTQGPRIMVFGCDHGVEVERARGPQVAALSLACIGQLPPAFIDYVLSRDLADGVLLTGCADGVCYNRFGIAWTEARLAGERDPHLRARVPRERLSTLWLGRHRVRELEEALDEFASRLAELRDAEDRAPLAGAGNRRTARDAAMAKPLALRRSGGGLSAARARHRVLLGSAGLYPLSGGHGAPQAQLRPRRTEGRMSPAKRRRAGRAAAKHAQACSPARAHDCR